MVSMAVRVKITVDIVWMKNPVINGMGRVLKDASLIFFIHYAKVTLLTLERKQITKKLHRVLFFEQLFPERPINTMRIPLTKHLYI